MESAYGDLIAAYCDSETADSKSEAAYYDLEVAYSKLEVAYCNLETAYSETETAYCNMPPPIRNKASANWDQYASAHHLKPLFR